MFSYEIIRASFPQNTCEQFDNFDHHILFNFIENIWNFGPCSNLKTYL